MCAIAGIIGLPCDESTAAAFLSTMNRRGPDEYGIFQDQDTTLLHTRLSIIDPDGGQQPMSLKWGNTTYVLVYNGELYNTEELRTTLLKSGHVFSGHSDTEVLLHSYAEWEEKCLDMLNGIFAFAICDTRKKQIFIARDRIGVKPLFFTQYHSGLVFASEMKTLFRYDGIDAKLDEDGAAQVLLLGPGRKPGSGVFHNIRELEPGQYAYFSSGQLKIHTYWKLRDGVHEDSFEDTADKVRWLVEDAIKRQLVSDVPIGTFLSGGLDSSIITAVSANVFRKKGVPLKTFSVDYLNNDRYFQPGKFQPNSDPYYIEVMQKYAATEHYATVLTPEDLNNALEEATEARDLPGMADVDFSMLAFCKEIRKQVKTALSGECADEIFGGYPWYRDPAVREADGFPWSQTTAQRASLLSRSLRAKLHPIDFVHDLYNDTCTQSDILPGTSALEKRMKEMVNLNFQWFMQTLLDRKDRMSMYSGLEVRVPFCDYRIAEYLYRVPWEYKDYHGREKGLLRYAFRDALPETILHRKKSPYPKTFDPRYEKLMEDRMQQILTDDSSPIFHIIEKRALENLLSTDMTWPWYGQLMRRPQTIAYFVQMDTWLRKYNVQFLF